MNIFNKLQTLLRAYFLTGLLVVVPVGITIYILKMVIGWADNTLALLPPNMQPETYLPFPLPGLGLIFTIISVMIVGLVTRNIVGKKLVTLGESIVDKIPLVRSIYVAVKQFIETIFSPNTDSFKRVILVEYPRKGLYSIAFVTGTTSSEIREKVRPSLINIFIPTSPNPTSGYLIMVPEEDTIPIDMDVELAFKLVLSGGMVTTDGQTPIADEPISQITEKIKKDKKG